MTDENRPNEDELIDAIEAKPEDPIGDETDGEAATTTGNEPEAEIEAAEEDALSEAEIDQEIEAGADDPEGGEEDEDKPESKSKSRPPAKLERLQKILAQAGIASRRKAEEMIEQGRVQVNGTVVTELGTKADAGRDHIRVDGKLLQGAERLRYFVLNKPRGFVTTVKDPEGRPTVMQFFDKMRERLYPVGRLDYMSEGLLVVTNDGELANKLTKASAGVEKTYLVKVAGIPTEAELDILRAGVAIEKGKPGSGKVRTSPARIRQVRQGDNPWYEVVLIEGRNRELRKMFEEVGHFVEKIRRVGYGPLVLDQEPGNLRELDPQELELLRKAADGKLKTPKAKEIRRRNIIDSLPPEKPAFRPRGDKPAAGPKDYKPKRAFATDRPARTGSGPAKFGAGPGKFGPGRPAESGAPRPAWKKDDRPARPVARFDAGSTGSRGESRPSAGKTYGDRPSAGRTFGGRPVGKPFGDKPSGARPYGDRPAGRAFPGKPAWKTSESSDRPAFNQPSAPPRRPAPEPSEDLGPRKPSRLHIEPVQDFGRTERPKTDRSSSSRPPSGYSGPARTGSGRSGSVRPGGGRSSSARPFRGEGGLARPFTTSSGKPRLGGARPSSKPGKEGGRSYGPGTGRTGPRTGSDSRPSFGPKRPFTPRAEDSEGFRSRGEESRPERKTGGGWKPKPNFGGKPKSDYKGKSSGPSGSGAKRSGPRPGGSRPGGSGPRSGGKKPGGRRP
jgi:23S rRNA pseudouridine2605 synthase